MASKKWLPLALLALLFGVFIIIGLGYSGPSFKLSAGHPTEFNEGWMWVDSSQKTPLEPLPTRLDLTSGVSYSIENVLNEDFHRSQHLLVRTSLANVRVELNDEVLYNVDFSDELTYASTWHIIEIPKDSEGATLRLTFDTPYASMHGILNGVEYGTVTSLYGEIFRDFGFRFIIGIGALFVGLVMLFSSVFLLRDENQYNAYLGLFATIMSLWLLSESRVLQFFIGNPNILGSMSYITLSLAALPMIAYIQKVFIVDYKKLFTVLMVLFGVNAMAILLLHFTGVLSFFESVVITISLIVVTVIIALCVFVIEYRRHRQKSVLSVLQLSMIMAGFIFIEVLVFSMSDFGRTSDYAAIALGIILVLIFVGFIRFSLLNYKGNLERRLYQHLAFTDQMTNAPNRYAYFNDVKERIEHHQEAELGLVYFDLDGLKKINDQHGHLIGDQAILEAYSIIIETFGDLGTCYRMGGDEFVLIAKNLDEEGFKKREEVFKSKFKEKDAETAYRFSISIGYAHFDATQDQSLKDTLRRSDTSMYLFKQSKHKKNEA